MESNLIPITRIYDIYPKYTYSNDVKKFMDEIVDIDRADVFTKSDMMDILDKIKAEIIQSIRNGALKIENGNEELFRIINKYRGVKWETEESEG